MAEKHTRKSISCYDVNMNLTPYLEPNYKAERTSITAMFPTASILLVELRFLQKNTTVSKVATHLRIGG